MAAKKPNLKSAAAEIFAQPGKADPARAILHPEENKTRERKNRRVELLAPEGLYEDMKRLAGLKGLSFNALLWEVAAEYRDKNAETLAALDKIAGR